MSSLDPQVFILLLRLYTTERGMEKASLMEQTDPSGGNLFNENRFPKGTCLSILVNPLKESLEGGCHVKGVA